VDAALVALRPGLLDLLGVTGASGDAVTRGQILALRRRHEVAGQLVQNADLAATEGPVSRSQALRAKALMVIAAASERRCMTAPSRETRGLR